MIAKPKIPVSWSEDDIKFIRNNYYQMTWKQLFVAIKELNKTATIQALRHQCIRMKLAKQVQIRWCKEDIQYLIDNYQTKGDKELAIDLNKLKRTFRVINGKKVYRIFKKKHIEKKMNLLGLKRSIDEYNAIRKRNIQTGLTHAWSKDKNVYTLGIKEVAKDGTIRAWKHYGRMLKHIKVDGTFKHYHRFLWEQAFGPVPKGYNVIFKDGDSMNCVLENLECITDREIQLRNSGTINLADGFVAFCLLGQKSTKDQRNKIVESYPELIEIKRQQMILTRKIKEQNESN